DGLEAGDYVIYAMGRNTDTNAASVPMDFFNAAGASSTTYNFSSLTATTQGNTGYLESAYTDEFESFEEGNNFVAINVTIATGQSLFLAVDGASSTELRGFLNAVQIVQVPEPSVAFLGGLGLLGLLRRRR